MQQSFDTGTQQLKITQSQHELMQSYADKTADPLAIAAAEVLAEAQLEAFYALAEQVEANPDITAFCVQALQRVELVSHVIESQHTAGVDPEALSLLGQLATNASQEANSLEAFFSLFAADNDYYAGYLARKAGTAVTTAGPSEDGLRTVAAHEQVTPEAPAPSVAAADRDEPAGAITQSHANSQPSEQAASSAEAFGGLRSSLAREVRINGELATLKPIEIALLQHMYVQGGTSRVKDIIEDTLFLAAAGYAGKDDIVYSAKVQRTRGATRRIDDQYPGLILSTGSTTSVRKHLNPEYTLEFITGNAVEHGVSVDGEVAPTERKASQHGGSAVAGAASEVEPRPHVFSPIRQVQRTEGQSLVEAQPVRMTKATKLLPNGFKVDNAFKPFSEEEALLIGMLNRAQRKQPITVGHLAAELRGMGVGANLSDTEVDRVLIMLKSKMPNGWLLKVNGNDQNSAGWRLGKGIRVVQQRNRPSRKSKAGAQA